MGIELELRERAAAARARLWGHPAKPKPIKIPPKPSNAIPEATSVAYIINAVALKHRLTRDDLLKEQNRDKIRVARHELCYRLMKQARHPEDDSRLSADEVALIVGRQRVNVIRACRTYERYVWGTNDKAI